MPEFELYETHALGGRTPLVEALPGVTIREVAGRSLVSVAARLGAAERVAEAVADQFTVTLPGPGRISGGDPVSFVWMGRDQWFADAPRAAMADLEGELRAVLGGDASLTEQSDSWVRLTVVGPAVGRMFEKLSMLDLSAEGFGPGSAARTVMEHLGVVILRPEGVEGFELWSARSSARSLLDALRHAAHAAAA